MFQTRGLLLLDLVLRILNIGICLGFGYSVFGFEPDGAAYPTRKRVPGRYTLEGQSV